VISHFLTAFLGGHDLSSIIKPVAELDSSHYRMGVPGILPGSWTLSSPLHRHGCDGRVVMKNAHMREAVEGAKEQCGWEKSGGSLQRSNHSRGREWIRPGINL
jgi:hypothetical protein